MKSLFADIQKRRVNDESVSSEVDERAVFVKRKRVPSPEASSVSPNPKKPLGDGSKNIMEQMEVVDRNLEGDMMPEDNNHETNDTELTAPLPRDTLSNPNHLKAYDALINVIQMKMSPEEAIANRIAQILSEHKTIIPNGIPTVVITALNKEWSSQTTEEGERKHRDEHIRKIVTSLEKNIEKASFTIVVNGEDRTKPLSAEEIKLIEKGLKENAPVKEIAAFTGDSPEDTSEISVMTAYIKAEITTIVGRLGDAPSRIASEAALVTRKKYADRVANYTTRREMLQEDRLSIDAFPEIISGDTGTYERDIYEFTLPKNASRLYIALQHVADILDARSKHIEQKRSKERRIEGVSPYRHGKEREDNEALIAATIGFENIEAIACNIMFMRQKEPGQDSSKWEFFIKKSAAVGENTVGQPGGMYGFEKVPAVLKKIIASMWDIAPEETINLAKLQEMLPSTIKIIASRLSPEEKETLAQNIGDFYKEHFIAQKETEIATYQQDILAAKKEQRSKEILFIKRRLLDIKKAVLPEGRKLAKQEDTLLSDFGHSEWTHADELDTKTPTVKAGQEKVALTQKEKEEYSVQLIREEKADEQAKENFALSKKKDWHPEGFYQSLGMHEVRERLMTKSPLLLTEQEIELLRKLDKKWQLPKESVEETRKLDQQITGCSAILSEKSALNEQMQLLGKELTNNSDLTDGDYQRLAVEKIRRRFTAKKLLKKNGFSASDAFLAELLDRIYPPTINEALDEEIIASIEERVPFKNQVVNFVESIFSTSTFSEHQKEALNAINQVLESKGHEEPFLQDTDTKKDVIEKLITIIPQLYQSDDKTLLETFLQDFQHQNAGLSDDNPLRNYKNQDTATLEQSMERIGKASLQIPDVFADNMAIILEEHRGEIIVLEREIKSLRDNTATGEDLNIEALTTLNRPKTDKPWRYEAMVWLSETLLNELHQIELKKYQESLNEVQVEDMQGKVTPLGQLIEKADGLAEDTRRMDGILSKADQDVANIYERIEAMATKGFKEIAAQNKLPHSTRKALERLDSECLTMPQLYADKNNKRFTEVQNLSNFVRGDIKVISDDGKEKVAQAATHINSLQDMIAALEQQKEGMVPEEENALMTMVATKAIDMLFEQREQLGQVMGAINDEAFLLEQLQRVRAEKGTSFVANYLGESKSSSNDHSK